MFWIFFSQNVNQQQSQILQVQLGEFLCPVCRQLSNTVLPIPPTSTVGASSTVPEQLIVRHIAELLMAVRVRPVSVCFLILFVCYCRFFSHSADSWFWHRVTQVRCWCFQGSFRHVLRIRSFSFDKLTDKSLWF